MSLPCRVLPGTAVRQQSREYGLSFQERPPYYVLGTNHLNYADLRRLRRDLKQGANVAPDAVEGMPEPRPNALIQRTQRSATSALHCIDQLWFLDLEPVLVDEWLVKHVAAQVDVVLKVDDLTAYTPFLATAITDNPATIFDVYLDCEEAPIPVHTLRQCRETLPFQPGYLDRVAVYQSVEPTQAYIRVSPRCFLLLPWTSTVEPADFCGIAEIIWRFELAEGDSAPLNAWYGAGGIGIWLHFTPDCTTTYRLQVREAVEQWEQETGRRVWFADVADSGGP